jgi:hypothetical protein
LFLSILPISKQILQDVWHIHTDRVDYLLAVTGNAFLIAGSLCMGLAHNIPVFMIGKSFKHAPRLHILILTHCRTRHLYTRWWVSAEPAVLD